MTLEEEIFAKTKADFSAFKRFGFKKKNGGYVYSELFLKSQFRVEVKVDGSGKVRGSVTEISTGDEYLPLRVKSQEGAFVNEVRKNYADMLIRIKEACFIKLPFLSAQGNRIAARLEDLYGDKPDFTFPTAPTYGVFRNPANRKWYGVVMNIPKSRLRKENDSTEKQERQKSKKSNAESDVPEIAEILNVKADAKKIPALKKRSGFYECYHMSKKDWITIILDDTLCDAEIMVLLKESRRLTASGKASRALTEREARTWIIPANPSYFDIEEEFSRTDCINWTQRTSVRIGDTVYIYIGRPVFAVKFKCTVIETDIPSNYKYGVVSVTKSMRLKLIKTYGKSPVTRERLLSCGVKSVRSARRIPETAIDALELAE